MPLPASKYTYRIEWSEGDQAHLARCLEFPSLITHGKTPEKTLKEIELVVTGAFQAYSSLIMKEEIEVYHSSGNVFTDLELSDAEEIQAKALLSIQIHDIIKRKHLTQAQAVELLGIDKPNVSALIRGRIKGFSMERLFHFVNLLGRDIQIVVKPKARSWQQGSLRVAAA
jgi:predicted XRE-type DNA-binding protein